ncbi:hypothetical protein ONZ45_g13094 [Pleurotus djamor]|nr:hypothetical protein ONZ45_g13094 [Pleurotus djamor]
MLDMQQTTQNILFAISQSGPHYWRQLRDQLTANSNMEVSNAAGLVTEELLREGEQVYNAAVSRSLEHVRYSQSLDESDIQLIRECFSSVAIRGEFGRRLESLLRYLLTADVLQMVPETMRMPSPAQCKVLATAWIASIGLLHSIDPDLAAMALSSAVKPLVTSATGLHDGAPIEWPHAIFNDVPLDTTLHVPDVRHLQEEAFPGDLSLNVNGASSTSTDSSNSTPTIVFHPLRGPYDMERHQ